MTRLYGHLCDICDRHLNIGDTHGCLNAKGCRHVYERRLCENCKLCRNCQHDAIVCTIAELGRYRDDYIEIGQIIADYAQPENL